MFAATTLVADATTGDAGGGAGAGWLAATTAAVADDRSATGRGSDENEAVLLAAVPTAGGIAATAKDVKETSIVIARCAVLT